MKTGDCPLRIGPLAWLVQVLLLVAVGATAPLLRAQSGALDTSFNPGTGTDQLVYSIATQTDGKILLGGDFTRFNNTARTNITRVNIDGTLDGGFDPGSAVRGSFPYVNAVALQTSGKILLAGSFITAAATNLARLATNGSLDGSFTAQADDTVNCMVRQTNGDLLIGGFFTHVNGGARASVARLTADGILDPSFNPTLAGDLFPSVFALGIQTDGKIIVGGSFTSINGILRTNLARLNANGTLDTNFNAGSFGGAQFSSAVYAVGVDAQGKVLAGGDFATVNGAVRTNLARFNGNGDLDPTFNLAAGTDSAVNALMIENDGRILVGGFFTVVNGLSQNYISRLDGDGNLDASFNPGSGADGVIYSMAVQSDGKILIGGGFRNFNGVSRGGIARLQNPPQLLNPVLSNNVFRVSVATLTGRSYFLEFKDSLNGSTWTALPGVAGDGTVKALMDPTASVPQRVYRVQVQ
jgi:uncharacterized delta-60 repeat protein